MISELLVKFWSTDFVVKQSRWFSLQVSETGNHIHLSLRPAQFTLHFQFRYSSSKVSCKPPRVFTSHPKIFQLTSWICRLKKQPSPRTPLTTTSALLNCCDPSWNPQGVLQEERQSITSVGYYKETLQRVELNSVTPALSLLHGAGWFWQDQWVGNKLVLLSFKSQGPFSRQCSLTSLSEKAQQA